MVSCRLFRAAYILIVLNWIFGALVMITSEHHEKIEGMRFVTPMKAISAN